MGKLLGEVHQCTPADTEAVISALAPTAPLAIKAAQNATTVATRIKTVALCSRRLLTPNTKRDQIAGAIDCWGQDTQRDRPQPAPTPRSMQMPHGSWAWVKGDTPAKYGSSCVLLVLPLVDLT